jgi:hypothetical protein
MPEEEKRKLLIAMYFLQKGAHQLNRLHDGFSRGDNESMERESNLFQAIARFDDMYLYSEEETEKAMIPKKLLLSVVSPPILKVTKLPYYV